MVLSCTFGIAACNCTTLAFKYIYSILGHKNIIKYGNLFQGL
jgi:hypothetical protein